MTKCAARKLQVGTQELEKAPQATRGDICPKDRHGLSDICGKDCNCGGDKCTACGGQGPGRPALMIEASSAEIFNLGAIPNGHSLLTLWCAGTCGSQGHPLQVASPKAAAVLVIAAEMSVSVIRTQGEMRRDYGGILRGIVRERTWAHRAGTEWGREVLRRENRAD